MDLEEILLPLSWASRDDIKDLILRSVKLPSGATFVVDGDVPFGWCGEQVRKELFRRFPEGFLLRGASENFYSLLGNSRDGNTLSKLSLGSSCLLEGSKFKPDKKLRNLVRRGEQELEFGWIEIESSNSARIEALKNAARGTETPAVEYFFRTDLLLCQAAFCAWRKGEMELLGALVLCRYGANSWHSELILRHPAAPPGIMEGLIVKAFQELQDGKVSDLNLGEVPLTYPELISKNLKNKNTPPAQRFLIRYGDKITKLAANTYNVPGLFRFKDKFATLWEPRYFVGTPKIYMRDLWALARLSNSSGLIRKRKRKR